MGAATRFAVNAAKKAAKKAEEKSLAVANKAAKKASKPARSAAKSTDAPVVRAAAYPSPFAITGKADRGQEVMRLKAKEMEVDSKLRTQPTGTDPVFDTSRESYEMTESMFPQSDPAAIQAALPRLPQGGEYPNKNRMQSIIEFTPQIAERLAEKAQQGRGTAQEYFYHNAPIVTGLQDVGVPRDDAIAFLQNKFAPAFAGTSPRTNTEQNVRNASMLMHLREKGIPINSDLYETYGNARGYNMMGNHQELTGKMFEGAHNPMTNPKPSAFLQNNAGDLSAVTADTHNIRGALLALNEVEPGAIAPDWFKTAQARARYADTAEFDPSKDIQDSLGSSAVKGFKSQTEYGPMADVTFEAARQAGIAPGPMQSLGWFGSGADTGLASATKTVPELLNERVNVTAQALGMDPKEVLKLFYRGEIPLMAEGGPVEGYAHG